MKIVKASLLTVSGTRRLDWLQKDLRGPARS